MEFKNIMLELKGQMIQELHSDIFGDFSKVMEQKKDDENALEEAIVELLSLNSINMSSLKDLLYSDANNVVWAAEKATDYIASNKESFDTLTKNTLLKNIVVEYVNKVVSTDRVHMADTCTFFILIDTVKSGKYDKIVVDSEGYKKAGGLDNMWYLTDTEISEFCKDFTTFGREKLMPKIKEEIGDNPKMNSLILGNTMIEFATDYKELLKPLKSRVFNFMKAHKACIRDINLEGSREDLTNMLGNSSNGLMQMISNICQSKIKANGYDLLHFSIGVELIMDCLIENHSE